MLLADVNLFIYAHRPESPRFEEHRAWLEAALTGQEPFGVSEQVLSSFVRIVTSRKVYLEPSPTATALDFCAAVLGAPAAVPVRPGARHWGIFEEFCRHLDARGNLVPDAYLAALALEHGATWVTTDHGFARFPGLRWQLPLSRAGGSAGPPGPEA